MSHWQLNDGDAAGKTGPSCLREGGEGGHAVPPFPSCAYGGDGGDWNDFIHGYTASRYTGVIVTRRNRSRLEPVS